MEATAGDLGRVAALFWSTNSNVNDGCLFLLLFEEVVVEVEMEMEVGAETRGGVEETMGVIEIGVEAIRIGVEAASAEWEGVPANTGRDGEEVCESGFPIR
jgi:hypothetical protein